MLPYTPVSCSCVSRMGDACSSAARWGRFRLSLQGKEIKQSRMGQRSRFILFCCEPLPNVRLACTHGSSLWQSSNASSQGERSCEKWLQLWTNACSPFVAQELEADSAKSRKTR